ncbi:VOC family protein [Enterococcus faecalis]|uniref:VOC family protein n=1 Tax=Enterococcus faecalis TaxID=1351 RepID=UPI0025B0A5F1|nr:VOC family protein [Enterococcus faecalis]MDN3083777.1 VOC family protein [Enterococcus faecalis]
MVQALPSNIGIQQVTLKVADLDKMVNFYTKTIGLKLLKQGEGRAWLAPQGTNDAILVLKELTAGEENQGTTGLYHIAFLLPTRKDLGNMLLWLLQENVQIGAADHGYSEALYLSDPENNGIEIYWDKPEEVWDIRPNGEIIGVTEELDGDSLATEADGHWLGISEGSKIGHIHLKVADLDTTQENQFGLENYTFRLPTAADLEIVQANAEEAKLHFIAKDHLLALEDPSGMIIQFTY